MPVMDLADVAASQWGLVTAAQARALGQRPQALARLTNRGVVERITHGVYRLAGTPVDQLDGLRAAWLAIDPAHTAGERLRMSDPVVVSHRSAASVQQWGDVEADKHEFSSPARRQTRRPDTRLHRTQVAAADWTVIEGLPVTTPVRTIRDLAAGRLDGGHLAGVVRDVLTTLPVDVDALALALRPYAHHYGAPLGGGEALLVRLLDEAGVPETIHRVVALTGGKSAAEHPREGGDVGR